MADSPSAVVDDKDNPETLSHGVDKNKDQSAGSVQTRKPTMADYFRVFSYATKWDFCTYALACFASIGGGAAMPLSKSFQIQLRLSQKETGPPYPGHSFLHRLRAHRDRLLMDAQTFFLSHFG